MQARAAETMAGAAPQVQRNKGSMGSKDLHLENFSVSNGGQELIEVCCVVSSSVNACVLPAPFGM